MVWSNKDAIAKIKAYDDNNTNRKDNKDYEEDNTKFVRKKIVVINTLNAGQKKQIEYLFETANFRRVKACDTATLSATNGIKWDLHKLGYFGEIKKYCDGLTPDKQNLFWMVFAGHPDTSNFTTKQKNKEYKNGSAGKIRYVYFFAALKGTTNFKLMAVVKTKFHDYDNLSFMKLGDYKKDKVVTCI